MRVRGVDHVGLTVADLERSLDFYCGLLGLRLLDRGDDDDPVLSRITGLDGVRARCADVDLGGRVLELIEYVEPRGRRLRQRPCDPGATHLALEVEDADALWQRLADAGVPVTAPPQELPGPGAWRGARCAYLRDPDGRIVELVERAPAPDVVSARGGRRRTASTS